MINLFEGGLNAELARIVQIEECSESDDQTD